MCIKTGTPFDKSIRLCPLAGRYQTMGPVLGTLRRTAGESKWTSGDLAWVPSRYAQLLAARERALDLLVLLCQPAEVAEIIGVVLITREARTIATGRRGKKNSHWQESPGRCSQSSRSQTAWGHGISDPPQWDSPQQLWEKLARKRWLRSVAENLWRRRRENRDKHMLTTHHLLLISPTSRYETKLLRGHQNIGDACDHSTQAWTPRR